MLFIYLLLFLILALPFYMYLEAGWLKVETLDQSRDRKGLKLMQISDVHIYLLRVAASRVRKVVKAENPDIIIFTGDYINKPVQASEFLEFFRTVTKGYRTLLCLGNHDLRAYEGNRNGLETFIREIERLGGEVVINRTVVVEKGGNRYNLIGLDDLRTGRPDIEAALKGCVPESPKIAFTHNPDLVLSIPGRIVDYLFCGHFHGGQIWMPFNLEFMLLRNDHLCRMGLRRGLHRVNDIRVYMNRGLGNVALPMRLFSRPEITVCYLK